MKKFNFVLRADSNKGQEMPQATEFAKMKKQFEPTLDDIMEENKFDLEGQDLNRMGNLQEGDLSEGVVQENVVVQNTDEEMPSENPLDSMKEGVLVEINLNEESGAKRPSEMDNIDLEPEAKRQKTTDEIVNEIINPQENQDNSDDQNMEWQNSEDIEKVLPIETRDELVNEILGNPELEKLIDQTMEKAENGELYVKMDKLTEDLIKELKENEGNEKEVFKKIFKELLEGATDKVDVKELMELDPKKLIELETQEIRKQLGQNGTENEVNQALDEYKKSIEGIFDQKEVEIKNLPESMREAMGYEKVEINPEKDPLIQAIRNINGQVQKEAEDLDDIAKRRANMVMKIVHQIESERIKEEKAKMNEKVMKDLFGKDDYKGLALPELKKALFKEKEEFNIIKEVKEDKEKHGYIRDKIKDRIKEFYKDDPKGEDKIKFMEDANSEDLDRALSLKSERIKKMEEREKALELEEKDKSNAQDIERSSFVKDQSQKVEATLKEEEKDPKFNALKEIDDLRESGKEIPKELIENAYKAFDVDKHPERKAAINEFIETGNVKERQEEKSISIDVGKVTMQISKENSYKKGSPEDGACEVGVSSLLNAVEYNKHLFGVIEKIEKPMEQKIPELRGVYRESSVVVEPQSSKETGGRGV